MTFGSCNISRAGFNQFLDHYDSLVKAKYCPKLSYDTWRKLKHIVPENDKIQKLTIFATKEEELLEFVLESNPWESIYIPVKYVQVDENDFTFLALYLNIFHLTKSPRRRKT